MKLVRTAQLAPVESAVQAKFAMVVPVVEATLFGLQAERIARLGGPAKVTLHDLAREYRSGFGDAGICFEFAVHDLMIAKSELIYPLAAEALQRFCGIRGDPASLLFGPEKEGRIPVLESVQNALHDESRLHLGTPGRPPKLKRHIPQLIRAFRQQTERDQLPRSIQGLWKADLFLGTTESGMWVGTTVKIKGSALESAKGLRIGVYPKANDKDVPRLDDDLNLVRLPLPYDGEFVELFWKSFNLLRAFMAADAKVPPAVNLPDSEDRFICAELEKRRKFPVLDVATALRQMAQQDLLAETAKVTKQPASVVVSENSITRAADQIADADTEYTGLVPKASATAVTSAPDHGQITWLDPKD